MEKAKENAEHCRGQVQNVDESLGLIANRVTHIGELNIQMANSAHNRCVVAQHVAKAWKSVN